MHALGRLAVLFTLVPVLANAQPFGPPTDQKPFERIEQFKKVRLIEMLDLKEDQSVRFLARMKDFDNQRRDLMKSKMDLLDKIERLVRNDADDKEFEAMFPQVSAVDKRMMELNQQFFNGLGDILTVKQRGKYLLFERQFERELREAMRETRRRQNR
jgi:homogentisate 1,2-dioxygenase